VDAQDADWVLGRAASENMVKPAGLISKIESLPLSNQTTNRLIALWILDFDKADTFDFANENCIELLVRGVASHDLYLPNPKVSSDLFGHF
jgi:hypothetical protein